MKYDNKTPIVSPIIRKLYLGNIIGASDKESLAKHQIKRVVSLTTVHYPPPELFQDLGIAHLKFPIPDTFFKDPDERLVGEVLPWMQEADQRGLPLLVHCQGGISRSTSLLLTYLMWRGMNFKETYQLLREVYPRAAPKPSVLYSFLDVIDKPIQPGDFLRLFLRRLSKLAAPL